MSARRRRTASRQEAAPPAPAAPAARFAGLTPARALTLPLFFTFLLISLSGLPSVRRNRALLWSFWGAGGALLAWNALVLVIARRRGRALAVDVALYKQHYLQACAHFSILCYWGWYWHEVYDAAPLIAAQLAFAYAFDALLTWSRRDTYVLGFGPFPIIFSTNLFLWFKPDWFYLQFLMVGIGFSAKQLIQWNKEGRRTHIFNPSSFTLCLFSAILILTGATDLTWGQEIATTQFNPPHIYLLIFLVSLPAQFLFGTASMTLSAVATTYVFGLLYFAAAGTTFFLEPPIPIAIFLGMHLLFTDPSTSPRTELGRLMFGMLYGLGVVGLFALLGHLGLPTFYDKLLPVPILNLLIRGIDRAVRSNPLKRIDPGTLFRSLSPYRRNLVYVSVWAAIFVTLQAVTGTQAILARGDSYMTQGRTEEAIAQYRELLRAEPNHPEGYNKLGFALMRVGRSDDAQATLRHAVELQPRDPEAHNNLGVVLMQADRFQDAVPSLERAVALKPDYAEAHVNLANAFSAIGQPNAAIGQFREALRARPDWVPALTSLAWLEATEAAPLRNADEAVRLASRAAELSGGRDPQALDALAAAYAAAGRFSDASRTAEAAEALAAGSGSDPELAAQIKAHLSLYRNGQPIPVGGR